MRRPLVSVILPTYNCAAFLAQAVESILAQSYRPLEVIAIDDGSSDGTLELLHGFGEPVRVFAQANAGPAAARNRAVAEARGEYLAFLDGDDLWLPGHTEALVACATAPGATPVVYGNWQVWLPRADGSYPPLDPPATVDDAELDPSGSGWIYTRMLFDSMIHIIGSLVHRSVFDAVGGFDTTLRTGSDYDFWLKVTRRFQVTKLRRPVAVYRHNLSSVTYTLRRENNAYRLLQRAIATYGLADEAGHAVPSDAAHRRLADLAFLHGYRHYWGGEADVALASFRQSLRHHAWQPKTAAYVIAALARQLGLPAPKRDQRTGS